MEPEALQALALSVAAARSPDSVLEQVVRGLAKNPGVALARVWLVARTPRALAPPGTRPGEPFLDLKASVGRSIVHSGLLWDRTDGQHQRLSFNHGKVGTIARTSRPLLLQRGPRNWLLQADWAEAERIESFAGQPLVFRGEVLGVVAVFSRARITEQQHGWLRTFADHAAVAIANARAFQEIERLKERLVGERDYLRAAVREALSMGKIVGESAALEATLRQARAVAKTDANVLVIGESGVGKELIASAIHDQSARADGPLVKVNCAAVPAELFESEFFGHVRGSFTGASRDREGRFQLAHGGTLFLDEVGEIPYQLQGKLLRVLQEGQFERVGEDETRRVDVRIVAATNRDLARDVESGRFRQDLYYRLSVFPIEVPPLRKRREDILPLAEHFLRQAALRLNVRELSFSPQAKDALLGYDWPGNIRELQNVIERAVILGREGGLLELRLPSGQPSLQRAPSNGSAGASPGEHPAVDKPTGPGTRRASQSADVLSAAELRDLERRNILNALDRAAWKVSGPAGAAALLGMKPSTLHYHMKTLGIERPRRAAPAL